jgi:hypothetical protein
MGNSIRLGERLGADFDHVYWKNILTGRTAATQPSAQNYRLPGWHRGLVSIFPALSSRPNRPAQEHIHQPRRHVGSMLVLLETQHRPHSARQKPAGQVSVLDAKTDKFA